MLTAPSFGSCCKDLEAAMREVPSSSFRIEGDGVLYLTVDDVDAPEAPAYVDQRVVFCPFCGTKLQDEDGASGPRSGIEEAAGARSARVVRSTGPRG